MILSENGCLPPIGLFPTGDLGLWTIYTTKKRRVISFLRTTPTKPASVAQRRQRNRWSAAARQWSSIGLPGQTSWREAAARSGLRITAFNLYIHYHTTGDLPCLQTIASQSSVPIIQLL